MLQSNSYLRSSSNNFFLSDFTLYVLLTARMLTPVCYTVLKYFFPCRQTLLRCFFNKMKGFPQKLFSWRPNVFLSPRARAMFPCSSWKFIYEDKNSIIINIKGACHDDRWDMVRSSSHFNLNKTGKYQTQVNSGLVLWSKTQALFRNIPNFCSWLAACDLRN